MFFGVVLVGDVGDSGFEVVGVGNFPGAVGVGAAVLVGFVKFEGYSVVEGEGVVVGFGDFLADE